MKMTDLIIYIVVGGIAILLLILLVLVLITVIKDLITDLIKGNS